jgi:hypothetical protein
MTGGILPHCFVKEVRRAVGVICFVNYSEPVLQHQFDFEFSHGTAFQKRTSTDGINHVVARAQCMRSWQPHSRSYATTRTDEARRDSAAAGFELSLCDRRGFEPTKIRRGTVSDRLQVGRLSCRISFGGCKPLRAIGAPMARLHRHRRRMVVWALEAQPTNAGHRRPTLLIAGEIAGCWSAIFVVSGAPRIAGRRLCRCRLAFAEQRGGDQEKRKDWQAHRDLPNRLPRPDIDLTGIARLHEKLCGRATGEPAGV